MNLRIPRFSMLCAGGAALVAGSVGMALSPESRPAILAGLGLASCGYLLGLAAILPRGRDLSAPAAVVVLTVALAARLALALAPPILEDDVYRYLWDGAVTLSGESPYRFSPQEIYDRRVGRDGPKGLDVKANARLYALAALSRNPAIEPAFLRINYPSVPTIYAPAAQGLFALVAAAAPGSVRAMKTALVILDLGVIALLGSTLRAIGKPRRWVLVYAWSPLVLLSFAGSGHMDVLAVIGLLAAIRLALGTRRVAAGALFGVAVATKFFPLIAWPALRRRLGVSGTATATMAVAALYAPFALGGRLFEGFGTYASMWSFNPAGFALVEGTLGALKLDAGLARPVAGLLVAAIAIATARSSGIAVPARAIAAAGTAVAALVILAPVVNPWYVAWIVPFCALRPSPALLALTLTILAYYALPPSGWSPIIAAVEFGIPALVALIVVLRRLRSTGLSSVFSVFVARPSGTSRLWERV